MTDYEPYTPAWRSFFSLVRDRFPYSKMRGVRISRGEVAAFGGVESTLNLGRGAATAERQIPDNPDDCWARFIELCRRKGDGVLQEVSFKDGRPLTVRLEHAGQSLRA